MRGRSIAIAAALGLCLALGGCTPAPEEGAQDPHREPAAQEQPASPDGETDVDPYATGVHHARVKVKGQGTVEVEIYSDSAPQTASRFCSLAEDGYYDGQSVYWVLKNLYARFGYADDDARGAQLVDGEYEDGSGETTSNISLTRGAIAMSRADDGVRSDASSLFVFLSDASYLDGNYAGFARVIDGIEVLDAMDSLVEEPPDAQEEETEARDGGKGAGRSPGKDDRAGSKEASGTDGDGAGEEVVKIGTDEQGKIRKADDYFVIKSIKMVD